MRVAKRRIFDDAHETFVGFWCSHSARWCVQLPFPLNGAVPCKMPSHSPHTLHVPIKTPTTLLCLTAIGGQQTICRSVRSICSGIRCCGSRCGGNTSSRDCSV